MRGRPGRGAGAAAGIVFLLASLAAPVAGQDADDGRPLPRASDLPWAGALAGSLALAATGPGLDRDLARETSADPGGFGGGVADAADVAGSLWLDYGAVAGTWAVSRVADWPEAGRIALRALVSLAATDAATAGLKVAFGRARPGADGSDGDLLDADRFDAFSLDEDHRSLPSGHAARMFALASTLDRELGDRAPWLPWVAYPAAALTGAGRVLEREHWPTDVVSGAALGLLTSRVAGRLFRQGDEGSGGSSGGGAGVRPWVVSGGDALAVGATIRTR